MWMGVAAAAAAACAGENPALTAALSTITADELRHEVQVLSADSMEGRLPSTIGEERTITYLHEQFDALGLRPGNGDSYFQQVPLVSITADTTMTLTVRGGGETSRFSYSTEFMGWTKRVRERVSVRDADMVFVGYGIVAPEYEWNDYEGMDVAGKTVVMLVNDPGFATQDTTLFTGNAMTYYGRWTYKYEEAARQGAAAAIIVHETAPAGYGWNVVAGSWSGPQFDLVRADDNMSRVAVEGWLTLESAQALFQQAGLDYADLKAQAATREFEPVPMGLTASVTVRNRLERSTSNNVLAVLPGGERADEYVVYMAHWDHLGRDPTLQGDQIFNGALDNATGIGGMLEIAEAFQSLETPPARSILFLAVTAEEQGLLGSAFYAQNPVYPLEQTVAAINMDGLNILGRMNDVTVVGLGQSELDRYLEAAADAQGRWLRPDPEPEKGFYFRSDHFNFAKVGVPALYADAGIDHVEHGEQWTRERRDEYTAERYHSPADEYNDSWDLTGAVDDLQLMFRVGYRLASERTFPSWSAGSPFKAARDSMMGGAQ
jgi:Zn-dependent M28 family amino/carboxypeptidase